MVKVTKASEDQCPLLALKRVGFLIIQSIGSVHQIPIGIKTYATKNSESRKLSFFFTTFCIILTYQKSPEKLGMEQICLIHTKEARTLALQGLITLTITQSHQASRLAPSLSVGLQEFRLHQGTPSLHKAAEFQRSGKQNVPHRPTEGGGEGPTSCQTPTFLTLMFPRDSAELHACQPRRLYSLLSAL